MIIYLSDLPFPAFLDVSAKNIERAALFAGICLVFLRAEIAAFHLTLASLVCEAKVTRLCGSNPPCCSQVPRLTRGALPHGARTFLPTTSL